MFVDSSVVFICLVWVHCCEMFVEGVGDVMIFVQRFVEGDGCVFVLWWTFVGE